MVEISDFFFDSNRSIQYLNATKAVEYIIAANTGYADNGTAMDNMFVLFSGYLVFLMQCGFAMLTAGSVRTKNTKNVLLKNVLDACVGALAYYVFGWAFAYGSNGNAFIGWGNFALSGDFEDFTSFFFQWAFAATAATIVSGSVAERTSFYAYMAYAFFLTAFVYPTVSHWIWSDVGFMSSFVEGDKFLGTGVVDFAGCSVVHMVGGFAGLVGAIIVGPRFGRFNSEGQPMPMPGHSATLATLGTFLLWFGWYGFNPGSQLAISGPDNFPYVARCAVTTTIAAATGGVTTLVFKKLLEHIFDLISVLNGILAGLVGITASCAFVEPWAAVVIGAIGAIVYIFAAMLLLKVKIDDPLEAFPIHGAAGFWGCLATGIFGSSNLLDTPGFLYGGGRLFLTNLVGCGIVVAWVVALLTPFFLALKAAGILRISHDEELIGNDISKHGGAAYPEDAVEAAKDAANKDIDSMAMDPEAPAKVDTV